MENIGTEISFSSHHIFCTICCKIMRVLLLPIEWTYVWYSVNISIDWDHILLLFLFYVILDFFRSSTVSFVLSHVWFLLSVITFMKVGMKKFWKLFSSWQYCWRFLCEKMYHFSYIWYFTKKFPFTLKK